MTTALLIAAATTAAILTITGYLRLGWRLAGKPFVIREVDRQVRRWTRPTSTPDADEIDRWRREAITEAMPVTLFWPIACTYRALAARMNDSTPRSPAELETELRQRDQRIAQLEHELGLTGNKP